MTDPDSIPSEHGRRAQRVRRKVPPIVWPIAAIVAMVPALGYLVVALLT